MTLANALLGYEPVFDSDRNITATCLSVAPADASRPLSVARVYQELSASWPVKAGTLLIDIAGANPDDDMRRVQPRENVWLGLSTTFANEADAAARLATLCQAGYRLSMRGELIARLPEDIAGHLALTIVPAGSTAEKPFACNGVTAVAQLEAAFAAGAEAVMGWPVDDISAKIDNSSSSNPSFEVIGRLLAMVNEGADPDELERVFKQDPSLSFRLLRYLNSAACGLRIEVQSIQHAVMMIGQKRLKKWLALLLSTAARDPDLKPLMYASLRRGLLLESLVGDVLGPDSRDEAFILGVFSLLDKLFQEPFESLFERLQIPEGVHDALINRAGPFMPYLMVTEALERAPGQETDDRLTDAFVERADCNTMLMKALGDASQTEAM